MEMLHNCLFEFVERFLIGIFELVLLFGLLSDDAGIVEKLQHLQLLPNSFLLFLFDLIG